MMYELLIQLAWKSVLTCGATLLLLRLLKHRSAAERSWIATAGVIATVLLPVAALFGPRWRVETPEAVPELLVQSVPLTAPLQGAATAPIAESSETVAAKLEPGALTLLNPETLGWIVYLVPVALLLLATVGGVLRLYLLRRRSEVLMEQEWLAALARAQRRMRFKHGTALLVSDDVVSPISWGFFRPTIVLNNEALNSRSKAEPIIAHELAHVARFDWAKLILGRAAAAVFWFNPLVWLLVRESHQLCEEAADDAVLAAEVPCTDYATLLVEVASHGSRGIMMTANGVAPGPASLKQRLARILNPHLSRKPAHLGWAATCVITASVAFTPLAAISPVGTLSVVQHDGSADAGGVANSASSKAPLQAAAAAPAIAALPKSADELRLDSSSTAEFQREVADRSMVNARITAAQGPQRNLGAVALGRGSTISLARFNAVELHGGGQIILRHGPRQAVRVASGSIQPYQLSVGENERLFVRCGHGCTAENLVIEVTLPGVRALAIHGGGTVRASGPFPVQRSVALAIHGDGTLDLRDLQASTVAASTHGGGRIMANALNELAASTIGGGEIRHWGSANVVSATHGGGKIEPGGT